MITKYKKGIDNYEYLAVCKIDGNELIYNPLKPTGLKQYLTRKGIKTDSPLDYFNIIPNPYKNTPKCSCKLCTTSYKDEFNKSGQLTSHIQNRHSMTIKDYIALFPEESHLFQYNIKELSREDISLTDEDSRVQCPICNKYFKAIKYSHTKIHGMTVQEFKEFTGLTELLSKSVKDRSREVYYQSNGLSAYKKPSKPKEPKVKKNKSRESVKQFVAGVDYHTYDTKTLLEEGVHYIYKITSPSGKCYIGRTNNFFKRMASHKKRSKGQSTYIIHLAIRKYGWDNMIKEIIDIVPTEEDAKKQEGYWMTFFDSYNNGYNSTDRTDGGHSWEGKKHTQQYRDYVDKVVVKSIGRKYPPRSQQTKDIMRSKAKGRHTLEWFQDKYGEIEGLQKYEERSDKLRNRTDQVRDKNGRYQ